MRYSYKFKTFFLPLAIAVDSPISPESPVSATDVPHCLESRIYIDRST